MSGGNDALIMNAPANYAKLESVLIICSVMSTLT